MALRNIVVDGDPILKKKCRPVTKCDSRLAQMLDDMGETMLEANGLGLAAPQIGVMRRIFVALDESDKQEAMAKEQREGEGQQEQEEILPPAKIVEFINPEVLEQKGEVKAYEGCLSYPGRYGAVVRPSWVKVRAFDRNGNPFEIEAEGILARCLCHESNHLDGVTLPDFAEYYYDDENRPTELDEPEDEDYEDEMEEEVL